MNLTHLPLENKFVRLLPLIKAHREGLRAASADPAIWRHWARDISDWDATIDQNLAQVQSGERIAQAASATKQNRRDARAPTSHQGVVFFETRSESPRMRTCAYAPPFTGELSNEVRLRGDATVKQLRPPPSRALRDPPPP